MRREILESRLDLPQRLMLRLIGRNWLREKRKCEEREKENERRPPDHHGLTSVGSILGVYRRASTSAQTAMKTPATTSTA